MIVTDGPTVARSIYDAVLPQFCSVDMVVPLIALLKDEST